MQWDVPYVVSRSLTLEIPRTGRLAARSSISRTPQDMALDALPVLLAFAAGAMIFVVVEELIPESQRGNHTDLATGGTMIGFAIMMMLDVALG